MILEVRISLPLRAEFIFSESRFPMSLEEFSNLVATMGVQIPWRVWARLLRERSKSNTAQGRTIVSTAKAVPMRRSRSGRWYGWSGKRPKQRKGRKAVAIAIARAFEQSVAEVMNVKTGTMRDQAID